MSRSVSFAPQVRFDQTLDEAFPKLDPGLKPFGSRVLVQMRAPKKQSAGGIILAAETQDTINWNTQVGRIAAIGPVAFKNRTALTPWPEGDWAQVGSFVRVPKYGGDRFEVPLPKRDDGSVLFVLFNDLDLLGLIEGDPLAVIAFV